MASHPPRKFAPVPVEETTRSSRKHVEPAEESSQPRRFKPEPVEHTTRSSKDVPLQSEEIEKPKPRRFAPEPVEHTVKSSRTAAIDPMDTESKPKPRNFAPQLVDESEKSSRSNATGSGAVDSESKPKPRRFAPQLVENTEADTKPKPRRFAPQLVTEDSDSKPKPRRFAPQLVHESGKSSNVKPADAKPHVKFKPEPIATTYGSNRRDRQRKSPSEGSDEPDAQEKAAPRKFAPILLDTATRSRRAGDPNAPLPSDYRTEYGYHAHPREHWRRVNGEPTESTISEHEPATNDLGLDQPSSQPEKPGPKLRAVCNLDGSRSSRSKLPKPERQHSFRAPNLETIESSESEPESERTSSPQTPDQEGFPLRVSSSYDLFKHATRRRESIDESWQHYLLDLERRKAQERLEEQALAAFPNADFGYEHPHHYFNLDDEDSGEFEIEERPVTWAGNDSDEDDDYLEMARRESTMNLMWEKGELQKHAEVLKQERKAVSITAKKATSQSPWQRFPDAEAPDPEMKSMRDRARPPMLGGDLIFVRCESPGPARFDVTQGFAALKNQMDYLTANPNAGQERKEEDGGLWQATKKDTKLDTTPQTPITPTTPSTKGLWGGFCRDDGVSGGGFSGRATPSGITGLMTPRHEPSNSPFFSSTPGGQSGRLTPANKNKSRTDLSRLTSILVIEREIDSMMDREYPDSFITQVYNYLSLGYPSLARPFDEELSKISRIPIPELRQDDLRARAMPRGFIRLGSDFEGGGGEGMVEDSCMRWRALKRYVREWAKQEKNWSPSNGFGGNWGTSARRGSWGI